MNIITKIRVLQEMYNPVVALAREEGESENAFFYRKQTFKEKEFSLPNNPLPRNHVMDLNGADNILLKGPIGAGKTTMLLNIADSLQNYQNYLKEGSSAKAKKEKDLPLFTDWQKMNTKSLFLQFKDADIFNVLYEHLSKDQKYNKLREEQLIARIMRNSNSHKGSKSFAKQNLESFAAEHNLNYEKFLEQYCFFVEAGLYLIKHNSPEMMFGAYELQLNKEINPTNINCSYFNFYNLPGRGMSQGQKTMHTLVAVNTNSHNNSLNLLDEPTNSLPSGLINEAAQLILSTKGQKLIATHNDLLIDIIANHPQQNASIISFYDTPASIQLCKYIL